MGIRLSRLACGSKSISSGKHTRDEKQAESKDKSETEGADQKSEQVEAADAATILKLLTDEVYALQSALPNDYDLFYYIDSNELLTLEIGERRAAAQEGGVQAPPQPENRRARLFKQYGKMTLTDQELRNASSHIPRIKNLNGFTIKLSACENLTDAGIQQLCDALKLQNGLSYLTFELKRCLQLQNGTLNSIADCALHFRETLTQLTFNLENSMIYRKDAVNSLKAIADALPHLKQLKHLDIMAQSIDKLDPSHVQDIFSAIGGGHFQLQELHLRFTFFKQLGGCFNTLIEGLRQQPNLKKLKLEFHNCQKFECEVSFYSCLIQLRELLSLSIRFSEPYHGPLIAASGDIMQLLNQNYYLNHFHIDWHRRGDPFTHFLTNVSDVFDRRCKKNASRVYQFQLVKRTLNRRLRKEVSWEIFTDFLNNPNQL